MCRPPAPASFPQTRPAPAEKPLVNALLGNAAKLLETASSCSSADPSPNDWTIFIGPEGGLQMVAGAVQSLESLSWTCGARTAWQVSHRASSVRVEGWHAGQRCILESPKPAARLVADLRLYELAA